MENIKRTSQCSDRLERQRRIEWGLRLLQVCVALLLLGTASFAQQSVRRAGEERDAEAEERRQRALSQLLLRPTRNLASAKIQDDEILLHTGKLEVETVDFSTIDTLTSGDVQIITKAAASKLIAPRPLVFADATVQPSSKGGSGRSSYSVWLKRTEDGWNLVFNREADVWGTQRDPAMDIAETTLTHQTVETSAPQLKPSLTVSDSAGLLELHWGNHRWSAEFTLEGN